MPLLKLHCGIVCLDKTRNMNGLKVKCVWKYYLKKYITSTKDMQLLGVNISFLVCWELGVETVLHCSWVDYRNLQEPYFCYFSEQDKRAWISSHVWGNASVQKLRNKANEWYAQYNNWKSNNKEKGVKHCETVGIFLRIIRGW